ncbi:retention module-containing protein, partial [Achromobacter spanius]|uniref:retention module-containing protein n=1 Tax=Achromobacter spanius TaxID=217203 RepID=UPI003F68ED78
MANSSPAVVNEISGRAWIRNSDGSLTELHQGSKVPAGSDIVTASGATVSLQVENGMPIVIGESREVAVNGDMAGPLADASEAAVVPPTGTDSDRLLAALQAGRDPFDELDPTAAIVAGGGDAGGSSFVRLARILETTSPLDLAYPNPARGDDTLPRAAGAGATGDDGDAAVTPPTVGNNAPNALNDASSGDQNSQSRGNLLSNDSDPDGDPLAITSINGRPMVPGGISVPGSTGGSFAVQPDGSYVFTPGGQYDYLAVGETATSTISYTITDPSGATSTATVVVTVTGTNDGPVSSALSNQSGTDAQTEIRYDVSDRFSDTDTSDKLTFSATGLPPGLSIDPDTGIITGTIDHSASQGGNDGVYTVTVTATDPSGASTSQEFNWDVSNPAPTAANDSGATDEDTGLSVNAQNGVLANDTDPDGDTLTVSQVNGQPGNVGTAIAGSNGGTFTLNADGSYSFNPGSAFNNLAANQTATSSITYTVSDGEGGTSTATLTVTITGTNDTPILTPDVTLDDQTGNDGQAITPVDVSGQFSDVDTGDVLTYSATGLPPGLTIDPTTGIISGTLDNSASQGGDNGVYAITITATDKSGASVSQDFSWDVKNPAPTAIDDDGSTNQGVGLNVTAQDGVLANDTDPDSDTLTVSQVNGQPGNVGTAIAGSNGGTFTLNADGSYSFNPGSAFNNLPANQTATSSITYTVSDGEGGTSTATLTVTITGTNDTPILTPGVTLDDQASNDGQAITPVDVSGQFSDVDTGDVLTYSATGLPPGLSIDPTTGIISGTLDNSASQGGVQGVYAITITATDTSGTSVSQDFSWDVKNPAPTATNDSGATDEDSTLSVDAQSGVLSNDTDPDGDTLTVSQVNGQATNVGAAVAGSNGGTFTLNADGSYSFNPGSAFQSLPAGEKTTSSITYTVSDGEGGTSTATLTVEITGTNDAPTAVALDNQSNMDGDTVDYNLSGFFSDIDDGDSLVYSVDHIPGGLKFDPTTGTFTGQFANWASDHTNTGVKGEYLITVTATDKSGATVSQTFVWTVGNPEPVATNDQGTTSEDNILVVDHRTEGVLGNDSDPDGDALHVSQVNGIDADVGKPVAGSNGGTFTLNADGTYSFNPGTAFQYLNDGQTATTSIIYTVADAQGATSTATLTITITGQTDAPPVITPEDSDGNVTSADNSVVEASGDTINGSVTVSAEAGIAGVTVGGKDVTGASAANPVVITTDKGILTVTGYNAATGTISYSYQETGGADDHTAGDDAVKDNITVTVTDVAGVSTSNDLVIQILDTAPVANDDNGGTVTEDAALNTLSGNVVTNDTKGADAITGVTWNVTDAQKAAIEQYGTLTLNNDGTWVFKLDNTKPAVQALNASDKLNFTLGYTVADADGDTSTANLNFSINGQTDGPPVITPEDSDGNVSGAHNSVVEGTGNTVTGSVTVSAEAGVAGVTVGGKDVTGASAANPVVITTDKGILTVTGYNAATGTISYSYQETGGADDHTAGDDAVKDNITVTVTDVAGVSTSNDLVIQILDTAPVANDDNGGTVTEDAALNTLSGNVVTNDTKGADAITGVTWNVTDAQKAAIEQYGTLTLNNDGTWVFKLDNTKPAVQALNASDKLNFTLGYTVADADGDTSTANLNFSINGQTDGPPVITPEDSDGNVSGAHNSVVEGTGNTVTGSVTVSAEAGVAGVTVGGKDVTGASAANPVVITTDKGILTVTGYNAATGTISYSYQETGGADDHTAGDDAVKDNITVTVTDVAGVSTSNDLVIQILDTAPVANDDNGGTVTEDAAL